MSALTVAKAADQPGVRSPLRRTSLRLIGVVLGIGILVLLSFLSVAIGTRSIGLDTTLQALLSYDAQNTDHLVILNYRIPRTVLGLMVGAALGLAGAVMQGVTRNPLADPGILGVNAGAALFVVLAISVFGISSVLGYVWFAFVGAGVAAVVVYSVASLGREGATPIKLALAGAAITAAFGAVTTSFLLFDQSTFDQFRFWQVGALAGRDLTVAIQVGAVPAGRGRARARPRPGAEHPVPRRGRRPWLGANVLLSRGLAAAGGGAALRRGHRRLRPDRLRRPDHPARRADDHRAGLPLDRCRTRWCWRRSCCWSADIVGRVIARPGEVQVAIVTAVIGAPVFIALVRRRKLAEL